VPALHRAGLAGGTELTQYRNSPGGENEGADQPPEHPSGRPWILDSTDARMASLSKARDFPSATCRPIFPRLTTQKEALRRERYLAHALAIVDEENCLFVSYLVLGVARPSTPPLKGVLS
jgi:hypothetical protein